MASVGEELLSEIERVSAKRERWRGYEREAGPRVMFGPAIHMMTLAIDAAKAALVENDALKCISALQDLQDYSDDD